MGNRGLEVCECCGKEILKNTDFRLATQADINKFFKGTKKREEKRIGSYEFYNKGEFIFYRYYGIGNGENDKFRKHDKNGMPYIITEKEYLEGNKK